MHTDGMLDESFHVFHVDVFQLRKYSSDVNTLNIMFFQCVLFHTHTFYLKMEGLKDVVTPHTHISEASRYILYTIILTIDGICTLS